MKPKHLFNRDKWFLGEHIPDCDIFFFQIPATCFCNDSSYGFIKKYEKFLGVYQGFTLNFYVGEKNSFEVAESILQALVDRPSFGKDVDKNIIDWSHKLTTFSKKVAHLPLAKYSNKQLWQLYRDNDRIHTKLYTYGWMPVAVDLYHNNFTKRLKSYLYSICSSKVQAEQAFIVLTTPVKKTILADEREDFLLMYETYKKTLKVGKLAAGLAQRLEQHATKWGHLGYIWSGADKPFGAEHYLRELKDLTKTRINSRQLLAKENRQLQAARHKQAVLYRQLKVSPLYRRLFGIAQAFALSKLVRRHAQLLNAYLLHTTLLTEIARRLHLPRYQVQFMLKNEVGLALLKHRVDKFLLTQRRKHCVLYVERGFEQVYVGKMEQRLKNTIITKVDKNIREITGQTAQPGFARGVVKIIFRARDMGKMNKGDILVSIATDPDVVPAMKKAGAIITEQGGITSHAAIVSRELGIPCVIGTKIATKVLKDGDRVEVDATRGIIRKL